MLTAAAPDVYAPVRGAWGRTGWTTLALAAADAESMRHALSYRNVAPKTLAHQVEGASST